MRELGVPAPRAGYAQVYVDGELFGLYLNVETVDDTFLERWFGDGHGPMWEGSYGTDFTPGSVGSFEYDEGPDPEDTTPLHEVTDVLARTPNLANLRSLLQLVDMDEVLAEQAAEHLSYHWDGYYTSNNYRVYDDPTDGKIALLPWGTDQTWLSTLDVYGGSGALFTWCLRVPACHAQYDNHLRLAAAAVGAIDLEGQLDDLVDYLTPNVPLDARGHRDLGWFQGDVDRTRDTLHNHPGEVLTRLELHCTGRNDPPGCYLCDTTAFGAMCRQPVDWYTADRVCRDFGMRLVMPKTDVLNTALSQVTAPYGQHWIGLSDEATEGRYRWVDGSTAAFTAWWSGEPNNCCGGEDCIGTNFGDVGRWNDYSCTTQLPFACQRAP
ncbi:MAG TPA: CotH kinase family protein, partial [Myxococcota bacterium]|nr:CotH kinase family protein [Myxococcota bacterium]